MNNLQFTIYKKIFLSGFIAYCLLLGGAYHAFAHGGVDDNELIIRMTENGFEPKELTVVEGDEVLFINNDDVERWPASNLHPTHGLYPEFDPLKGIKPGDSWKMTFAKVGTWRMHDHLIPHMTGTIVVLSDSGQASTTPSLDSDSAAGPAGFWAKIKAFFSKLFRSSQKNASAVNESSLAEFQSLSEKGKYAWLEERAQIESPEAAWAYVLKTYDSPAGVIGKAHDMAHLVGQLIFKKYGLKGLPICTPAFAFGCYHGLMAVAFEGKNLIDYQKSILEAEKGCQKLGNSENPANWSCIHGMGHGIITYRDHETKEALLDCDLLGERVRTYCYDGVFMELSISAVPSFYKESDPLYPCNAINENYQTACARAQSRVMRSLFSLNTTSIAKICMGSTNTIRYHCIDSLGYFAAEMSVDNPKKVIAECESIVNGDDQAQCKAAAAGELVFQNTAGWQKNSAMICESMNANYLSACMDRIESVKKSYGR